jgi:hypothetical protein
MRFFYKVDPEDLTTDKYIKLECELIYLSKMQIIPVKL